MTPASAGATGWGRQLQLQLQQWRTHLHHHHHCTGYWTCARLERSLARAAGGQQWSPLLPLLVGRSADSARLTTTGDWRLAKGKHADGKLLIRLSRPNVSGARATLKSNRAGRFDGRTTKKEEEAQPELALRRPISSTGVSSDGCGCCCCGHWRAFSRARSLARSFGLLPLAATTQIGSAPIERHFGRRRAIVRVRRLPCRKKSLPKARERGREADYAPRLPVGAPISRRQHCAASAVAAASATSAADGATSGRASASVGEWRSVGRPVCLHLPTSSASWRPRAGSSRAPDKQRPTSAPEPLSRPAGCSVGQDKAAREASS